jgi:hypothetical protein
MKIKEQKFLISSPKLMLGLPFVLLRTRYIEHLVFLFQENATVPSDFFMPARGNNEFATANVFISPFSSMFNFFY